VVLSPMPLYRHTVGRLCHRQQKWKRLHLLARVLR
jgi:hypothetical protein